MKDIVSQIFDTMDISVSTRTIQFYSNRNGLHGNWPRRASLHKPCYINTRFDFAETFLDKENCFWEQVLWIDGRKIELFGRNDVPKIWRKKGEGFLPKNTVPTLKHGSCLMMFWSRFSTKGTGQFIAIRGVMKFEDYIKFWKKIYNYQRKILI